jgi:hypothetical protein
VGVFITSTKNRTWKHSLIWFADKVKNAALAVNRVHPSSNTRLWKRGGRRKEEGRRGKDE